MLKNLILLLNRGLIVFSNGHICNVDSTLPNVVKIDVKNDNVVLTLSNIVQFNVGIHNVASTFLNVVNYNVDVTTFFQRWFDVVQHRDVISTYKHRSTDFEMFAGEFLHIQLVWRQIFVFWRSHLLQTEESGCLWMQVLSFGF